MKRLSARLRWRRLPWLLELVLIGLGYGAYSLVRLMVPSTAAFPHAYRVLTLERALGLFHELALNSFLIQHHWLEEFSSYYYASAHFVVTPAVLVFVFRRHAWAYPTLRSAIVLSTLTALVVYAAWPLAPPRFVVAGAVDTVFDHPVVWARGDAVEFVNEFAAMPSLHVAWAVWCAAAVVVVLRRPWRHLAWLYPLATTWVVVATANHYIVDAIAGAVVALVPLYACGLRPAELVRRRPQPQPQAPQVQEPVAA